MFVKIIKAVRRMFADPYKQNSYVVAREKREARKEKPSKIRNIRWTSGVFINEKSSNRYGKSIPLPYVSQFALTEEEKSANILHRYSWRDNSNPWLAPEFRGIYLVGKFTDTRWKSIRDDLDKKRAVWKPSQEAYDLLEMLRKDAIGRRIIAKFYDIFWATLDEREGIQPLLAKCIDVKLVDRDRYDLPQVYIHVSDATALNLGKTSPFKDMLKDNNGINSRFNLGDLYELLILD